MAEIIKLKPTRPCPICGKPSSQQYHPFCSARCADIDLNRWLSGSYVIPAEPAEDEANDAPVQREDDED
jgi:endogenous inhibitor of DNA gyrase (YacG/DUF329 family)